MSILLDSSNFGEKLYNTLPPMYLLEDSNVNNALERYLNALADGGYRYLIEEINGLTNLIDPDKVPSEVLPVFFSHYGLEIFNGLPDVFLRKMLPMISELYTRKGTTTVIEYLTSLLTGVKTTVEIDPDFDQTFGINVRLEMDYNEEENSDLPDRDQMLRIINEFMPFFCKVLIVYSYLFYESGRLRMTERTFMTVFYKNEESPEIARSPMMYTPVLNQAGFLLNQNLILNRTDIIGDEPDIIVDKVKDTKVESSEILGDTDLTLFDKYSYEALLDNGILGLIESIVNKVPFPESIDSQSTELEEDSKSSVSLSVVIDGDVFSAEVSNTDITTIQMSESRELNVSEYIQTSIYLIQSYDEDAELESVIAESLKLVETPVDELTTLDSPVYAVTNSENSLLNGSFYLNSVPDFEDIVTNI